MRSHGDVQVDVHAKVADQGNSPQVKGHHCQSSTSGGLHPLIQAGVNVHRESKKGCHPNHGYNFVNSWCICKILSLLQRAVNFQQN